MLFFLREGVLRSQGLRTPAQHWLHRRLDLTAASQGFCITCRISHPHLSGKIRGQIYHKDSKAKLTPLFLPRPLVNSTKTFTSIWETSSANTELILRVTPLSTKPTRWAAPSRSQTQNNPSHEQDDCTSLSCYVCASFLRCNLQVTAFDTRTIESFHQHQLMTRENKTKKKPLKSWFKVERNMVLFCDSHTTTPEWSYFKLKLLR